jgi:phage tail sheath protein FI
MPEYLSPGVYVEEIEIGAKPIEGVSTSTVGFLGLTEHGPTAPRLVTGFEQFKRIYGGFTDKSYLAYAVDGFFRNGGQRCFVGRITPENAEPASADLDTIGIDAIGPGDWGNNLAIKIDAGSLEQLASPPDPSRQLFKLTVAYWSERPPTPPVDPTDRTRRTDVNRLSSRFTTISHMFRHRQIITRER